jgi:phosphonate transport system permease protein
MAGDGLWDYVYALKRWAMASPRTVIAAVIALPLRFLGAKNIVPNWFSTGAGSSMPFAH